MISAKPAPNPNPSLPPNPQHHHEHPPERRNLPLAPCTPSPPPTKPPLISQISQLLPSHICSICSFQYPNAQQIYGTAWLPHSHRRTNLLCKINKTVGPSCKQLTGNLAAPETVQAMTALGVMTMAMVVRQSLCCFSSNGMGLREESFGVWYIVMQFLIFVIMEESGDR
jgi:hypothetical protein